MLSKVNDFMAGTRRQTFLPVYLVFLRIPLPTRFLYRRIDVTFDWSQVKADWSRESASPSQSAVRSLRLDMQPDRLIREGINDAYQELITTPCRNKLHCVRVVLSEPTPNGVH